MNLSSERLQRRPRQLGDLSASFLFWLKNVISPNMTRHGLAKTHSCSHLCHKPTDVECTRFLACTFDSSLHLRIIREYDTYLMA